MFIRFIVSSVSDFLLNLPLGITLKPSCGKNTLNILNGSSTIYLTPFLVLSRLTVNMFVIISLIYCSEVADILTGSPFSSV
nr:MAG TPA_asm: hypothetical protein [Bacteriophage sp.]